MEGIEEERQKRAKIENERLVKQDAERQQLDEREARMLAALGNVMDSKSSFKQKAAIPQTKNGKHRALEHQWVASCASTPLRR